MQKKISCPHFPFCCSLHNTVDDSFEPLQRAKNFFNEQVGIDFALAIGAVTCWRGRAKLAVRQGSNGPLIGIFKSRTHQVLDIPCCRAHHPKINEAVENVRRAITKHAISCYDEKTHTGELRYLQAVVERSSQKVQLTCVINTQDEARIRFWRDLAQLLFEKEPQLWHSLWLNIHTTASNTIFGNRWIHVIGEEVIWEEIAHVKIPFAPSHFGQGNLEMFERLISDLKKWIPPNVSIVELYAGVGVIGLCLADICKNVLMTEVVENAKPYFELAKKNLAPSLQSKLVYHTLAAEKSLSFIDEAELLLVDPPRKGLDQAVIESIARAASLKYVAYVSCNWDSFERDCMRLMELGWHVVKAQGYLFFPGTDHIETLTLFARNAE